MLSKHYEHCAVVNLALTRGETMKLTDLYIAYFLILGAFALMVTQAVKLLGGL